MPTILSSDSSASADPTGANHALCAEMSLLFTLMITALAGAISRTGGKPLADQFEQQLERYGAQHGWSVLTGLKDLAELKQRVPDVDARILLSVYLAYAQYARELGRQVLGEQMLKSTLAALLKSLPPRLADLNAGYEIIRAA